MWVCYRTGTLSGIATPPGCAAAGSATSITAAGSGKNTQCTPANNDGAAVSLTWADKNQTHIQARACKSASDSVQSVSAQERLVQTPIALRSLALEALGSDTDCSEKFYARSVCIAYG